MKYTQEQIERAAKKLAVKLAAANYPHKDWTRENHHAALWEVFSEALRLIDKMGARHHYENEMRWHVKHDRG